MSKKLIVEVDVFARLLSLFYDKKAKGKEDDLEKAIDASDSVTFDRAYKAWKSDSEKLLISTKNLLKQSGASTAKIDALLKQYHNY
jgi:hypothetical protein